MSVCACIVRYHWFIFVLLVCGYGGFDIELRMLTVTCGAVVVFVGCCAIRFPYLRSLVDCYLLLALRSSSARLIPDISVSTLVLASMWTRKSAPPSMVKLSKTIERRQS